MNNPKPEAETDSAQPGLSPATCSASPGAFLGQACGIYFTPQTVIEKITRPTGAENAHDQRWVGILGNPPFGAVRPNDELSRDGGKPKM